MVRLKKDIEEFRRQLEKGSIRIAYRALLDYMMGLRAHFSGHLADSAVSGLHQGYMDITYFALIPSWLKQRNLKIAIVFNYDDFRFEAWLAGRNRQAQRQCWRLMKRGHWPGYRLRSPAKGVDSILECDLATEFDLSSPEDLTASIEAATVAFMAEIETFLASAGSRAASPSPAASPRAKPRAVKRR